MKITMFGAAGEVTGSAYCVETVQARLLVDFGMFQGVDHAEDRNRVPKELKADRLDAVVLTHAHLDHVGRLPLLVKAGYQGPIYCTPATIDLTGLILRDSAKVQQQDIARLNRRRERDGKPPVEPLYQLQDVEALLRLLKPVSYQQSVKVAPGVQARFVEAGHMLGSASIELVLEEHGHKRTVVFSGDVGQKGTPILKDFETFQKANLVFLESTYGDRDHKSLAATMAEFEDIVKGCVARQGKMLVPTFAVGRAQLLVYLLTLMFRNKVVPKFPVYVDSPMAIEATKIYQNHPELMDEQYTELNADRALAADMSSIHATVTAEESKALNAPCGPCLVMAGAGMCNAGRIVHHLRHNLPNPQTSVIIVGFQSDGSLGRQLVDGRKEVFIFGERVAVNARIHTLGGFSAHAGQSDLLRWFNTMSQSRPRVVLTHGEARGREPLAALIKSRYLINAELPMFGDVIEL
ncbi:MAG: MBL fold metallo-hydrolase [Opitutaceae bacterium]|nr:MBL fold metallo-hydrolase [Verrucomicrobiales bacterium]